MADTVKREENEPTADTAMTVGSEPALGMEVDVNPPSKPEVPPEKLEPGISPSEVVRREISALDIDPDTDQVKGEICNQTLENSEDFQVLDEEASSTDEDKEERTTTSNDDEPMVGTESKDITVTQKVKDNTSKVTSKPELDANIAGMVKVADSDADVILVNPLFGKPKHLVPVIDIGSDDDTSGEESDQEDFSVDVDSTNFETQRTENTATTSSAVKQKNQCDAFSSFSSLKIQSELASGCSTECQQEKGILINEIERLRRAVFELSERQSILEDFVDVEYSEGFHKFLKNRDHLMKMGFGTPSEYGSKEIDGRRSSKSSELIELLKMIKEQAKENAKEQEKSGTGGGTSGKPAESSTQFHKPSPKAGSSSTNQQQRCQSGSTSHQKKYQNQPLQKSKQASGGSGRNNYNQTGGSNYNSQSGWGGLPSYTTTGNAILSRNPVTLSAGEYQFQQQVLAQQMRQQQFQSDQSYYNSMYSNVIGGGGVSRGYGSMIGRSGLTSTPNCGYNMGSLDGTGSGYSSKGGCEGGVDDSKSRLTKNQRKRKRQSEVSSEASSSSTRANSKAVPLVRNPLADVPKHSELKKLPGIGGADVSEPDLKRSTRRVCFVCQKVMGKRALRDHLILHKGCQVFCPICNEEFVQRRRIKIHMRDMHNMSASEYTEMIAGLYAPIEREYGAWLDKQCKLARFPTEQEMLEYLKEVATSVPSSENGDIESPSKTVGQARKFQGMPATAPALAKRIGSSRAGKEHSTVAGSSSRETSADMYGPGGYAQYAAKYLQQRSATSSQGQTKLYTPF